MRCVPVYAMCACVCDVCLCVWCVSVYVMCVCVCDVCLWVCMHMEVRGLCLVSSIALHLRLWDRVSHPLPRLASLPSPGSPVSATDSTARVRHTFHANVLYGCWRLVTALTEPLLQIQFLTCNRSNCQWNGSGSAREGMAATLQLDSHQWDWKVVCGYGFRCELIRYHSLII